MEKPLVSVIIPFYSGIDWLREALNSVQKQTYKNIEVLVINDGSKENISCINKIYDLNIKIINKENGGPASARNLGIEKASGKYIAFLDSDDLWLPDKLSVQIREMESKKYVWSQHSYEMFWQNKSKTKLVNTKIYSGDVYRECFISFKVQTSCVVVLRSILMEDNIRFPIEKRYGQDMFFFKQIAKKYPLGYIEGVYSRFRIRGTNAGFRAKVQIDHKADIWNEIKSDKETLKILPKPIIIAYKITSLLNKVVYAVNKKIIKSEKKIEIFSKFIYLIPYTIFKLHSKK
ncbi:glycosyltransferase family 2 protein [Caloramator sp. ALD01]|uniref:glycosyltransferase family 2 protein n=1 Tax=Caloramator sp. ALD01 TaxID=1031288 RepID=UPI000420C44F|nr:glycosyltransferase family 2 protein [Caloramator sp. ALD01]